MTEAEVFNRVLQELAELLLDLGDLSSEVMLIGGQVLALLSKQEGGSGSIDVVTDNDITIERGFSLEPDLLFDIGSSFQQERLTEVLRARGFHRTRGFRWSKPLTSASTPTIDVDLFAPPDVAEVDLPTPMTPLPDAELALRRRVPVSVRLDGVTLRIAVPDPVAFLQLKLRAKLEQRPHLFKDSFDLYAYVKFVGRAEVDRALGRRDGLEQNFARACFSCSGTPIRRVYGMCSRTQTPSRTTRRRWSLQTSWTCLPNWAAPERTRRARDAGPLVRQRAPAITRPVALRSSGLEVRPWPWDG